MPERETAGKLASSRTAPEDDGPMKDPFLRAIRDALAKEAMLRQRDSVLVAVSGGPDSVALLAGLVTLGEGRWRIGAGHVNHRLRGRRSQEDQRFVERIASALRVPVLVCEGRIAPGGNLEERARDERYAALLELAREHGYRRIATAHTLDDQAETILLRLLRGAGGGGLAGITPVRRDGVIRPLLGCTRDDVLAFLRRRALRFRSDETNRSLRFMRNRVRRKVIPLLERELNPAARRALARTAILLRDDEELLAASSRRAWRRVRRGRDLAVDRLRRLAPALQRRVIRIWLAEVRGDLLRIGAEHVDAIRDLALSTSGRLSLPGGTVVRSGGTLSWNLSARRRAAALPAVMPGESWSAAGEWRIRCRLAIAGTREARPGRWRAVFDRKALDGQGLRVRPPVPGDRIRLLGLGGSKKLQDVFVDGKVPREDRSRWPVVEAGRTIVWVPGLARSETGRVSDGGGEVLVVEARRIRRSRSVAAE
jgi:tRNA(Ile)-lysidine synthase